MNKKLISVIIIFLLFFSSIFASSNFSNESLIDIQSGIILNNSNEFIEISPYKYQKNKEIKINNFNTKLEVGVDNDIKLNSKNNEKTHSIIQFNKVLSNDEKEKLRLEGIDILDFVSNNTYYVSIKKDLDSILGVDLNNDLKLLDSNFNDKYIIKSISKIKPEYKLAKNIRDNKIGSWAKDKKDNIYLIVEFQKDINTTEKKGIIKLFH